MTKRKVVAVESTRSSQRQSGPGLAAQVTGAAMALAMALAVALIQSVAWSALRVAIAQMRRLPTLRRRRPDATPTTGAESWRKTAN